MNNIKSSHLTKGLLCAAAFAVFLAAAFYHWLFLAPALLSLAGYFLIDRKFLRCPGCGGFTNLDRLLHAKSHPYYCSHCGKRILIEK